MPPSAKQVNAFVDEWHDDAAHARMAYFDKIAKDGVYIGTDKTELWHRDEFKAWAKKYFERKSAWTSSHQAQCLCPADKKYIWFDELLDTQMGLAGPAASSARLPAVSRSNITSCRSRCRTTSPRGHQDHQGIEAKPAAK